MGIAAIFAELGEGIARMFVNIFTILTEIFFVVDTTGDVTSFSLQPIGYLALIGLVLSVVYFAYRALTSYFRVRGGR